MRASNNICCAKIINGQNAATVLVSTILESLAIVTNLIQASHCYNKKEPAAEIFKPSLQFIYILYFFVLLIYHYIFYFFTFNCLF